MVIVPMISGRLSIGLVLACGAGLFSVSCLSNKSDSMADAEPPPASAYPATPAAYGDAVNGAAATSGAYPPSNPAYQAAAPAAPEPFQLREGETLVSHLIVSGESLTSIAGKYKSSISRIQDANKLSGTTIFAGKTIQVPVMGTPALVMNGAQNGAPAPGYAPTNGSYPAQAAPPVPSGTGYGQPIYPGTAPSNPASTSYPRSQTPPSYSDGAFPTPSF